MPRRRSREAFLRYKAANQVKTKASNLQAAEMIAAVEKKQGVTEVRALLRAGYPVDQVLYEGQDQTALHLAAWQGREAICRILLDAGAAIEGPENAFSTPLHQAAGNLQPKVVRLLIERGANVNACNRNGETPLYKAAAEGSLEISKMLIEAGADLTALPNEGNDDYWTPFEAAVQLWDGEADESPKLVARKIELVTYLVTECKQDPNPERMCSEGYPLRDLYLGQEPMDRTLRMLHTECLVRGAIGDTMEEDSQQPARQASGLSPL